MNTTDSRFIIQLTAPVTFQQVGPFAAVRVEIVEQTPRVGLKLGTAAGFRFRPLRDTRTEESEEPEPLWVELGSEWFAAEANPSEENALSVIETLLAAPPAPDLAALQKQYDDATEVMLDQRAGSWGYKNMSRATTYVSSTNPQWAAEAAALVAHRDAVWLAGFAILQDVLNEVRPILALADYLAELPELPTRPVV